MSRTGISRLVRFLVNFSEVYAMSFAKKMHGIAILFALAGFICAFSACSGNTTPQKLSELDETALLQRLADYEVVIPANLELSAIRDAIADLEADPDRPAPVVGCRGRRFLRGAKKHRKRTDEMTLVGKRKNKNGCIPLGLQPFLPIKITS